MGTTNVITFTDGVTTTGTWQSAPNLPTLVAPDYVPITVAPDTPNEEIVHLTAYTAGATTGTFARGQENSAGVAHSGVPWVHGPTAADFVTGTTLYESWLASVDVLVAANTPTNIVSLDLPAGDYDVSMQCHFANPAGNGAPGNYVAYFTETSAGAVTTKIAAAEYQSLPPGQGLPVTCEKKLLSLSVDTVLYLVFYGSLSGNVWHFGNFTDHMTGLMARSL